MDDIAFKLPRKILWWILVVALVIAVGYGVVTWNSKKAADLWIVEVQYITKPIFNFYSGRIERMTTKMIEPVVKSWD